MLGLVQLGRLLMAWRLARLASSDVAPFCQRFYKPLPPLMMRVVRQGGRHEVWLCGRTKVTIPRHREINEITAQAIFKTLEAELGHAWWRR